MLKARSESEEWALAQLVDKEVSSEMEITKPQSKKRWSPPIVGWLMCNVALEWDKQRRVLGVAWVVQNHRGVVPSHSRRAFSDIENLEEARLTNYLCWGL